MLTRNTWIFIAAAWLLAAACSQPAPPASESARAPVDVAASSDRATAASAAPAARTAARPRIVFLGDSLTAGLGLAPDQSVPSLVQRRLEAESYDYEVVNAGVSGDTSAGGLSRLDWSLEGDVRVLVVELGANDGLRGISVASMKQNLAEIITRAKARGITVLLTGMEALPNYGMAYTSEFRQAFRDLAEEHDVAFVPFFLEGVAGDPALNQRDLIHPNPEGAQVIERTIWASLEPLLEEKD